MYQQPCHDSIALYIASALIILVYYLSNYLLIVEFLQVLDTYDLAFNLISGKGTEGLKVKYKKRQVLTVRGKSPAAAL